jgi:hypothetical protein
MVNLHLDRDQLLLHELADQVLEHPQLAWQLEIHGLSSTAPRGWQGAPLAIGKRPG